MLMSSARSMTMSAFLPGDSVPILPSIRKARAPPIGRPFERLARSHRKLPERRVAAQRVVADFLAAREQQRRLHLAEHLPGGERLDVDAERRQAAGGAERRHLVSPM